MTDDRSGRLRPLVLCLALLAALLPAAHAWAQATLLYQLGRMTAPGDLVKLARDGQVVDVGGVTGDAAGGNGVNPFAIKDKNALALCANTDSTSAAYNAFCIGHDASGNALISLDSYGMANKTAYFRKNGTLYEFPFNVSGAVAGPVSSTVGNVACWNNASGNLLKDCGVNGASLLGVPPVFSAVPINPLVCGSNIKFTGVNPINVLPAAPTVGCVITVGHGYAGGGGYVAITSASQNIVPISYLNTAVPPVRNLTPTDRFYMINYGDWVSLQYDSTNNWRPIAGSPAAVMWAGQTTFGGTGVAKVIHQNQGAYCFGHGVLMADCNTDQIADFFSWGSVDLSIVADYVVSGTPTAGESPGVQIVVAGSGLGVDGTYLVTYTVQGGDTNTSIATALGTAIQAGTSSPAGLGTAYAALDQTPASSGSGTSVLFDYTWPFMTVSPINTAHTTLTAVTGIGAHGNVDNNPTIGVNRTVKNPGTGVLRTTIPGDLWMQDVYICNGFNCGNWINATLANTTGPIFAWGLGGANYSAGGSGQARAIWLSNGLQTSTADGSGNPCVSGSDSGPGNIWACGIIKAALQTGASSQMGQLTDATTFAAWGSGAAALDTGHFALATTSTHSTTILNAATGGTIQLAINDAAKVTMTGTLLNPTINEQIGGTGAFATNATGPFQYIAAGAGAPSGVPTAAAAGQSALYNDTTNHKICFYEQPAGAWKCALGS